MLRSWIFLLLVLFSNQFFCQYNWDWTPVEDGPSLATKLSEIHEDDEGIIHQSYSHYSFEYDDKLDFPVYAMKESNQVLMALKRNAELFLFESTDNESEITDEEYYEGRLLNKDIYLRKNCISNFSQSIFSSDLEQCVYPVNIPDKGDIRMLEIKKKFLDVKYLTSDYFRSSYPIAKKDIEFLIPDWLELEILEMNFDAFDIEKKEENVTIKKENFKKISYKISNLKGMPKENGSPGISYNEPHLVFIFKSYTTPDGDKVDLFQSTDDLYGWYKELIEECGNEPVELVVVTNEVIKDATSDVEKISKIFYWVQDNIKYIAFEDGIMGFKPDAAQNVCEKRYGDCKGMANLAKVMFENAGFDARLTWIGTNRISPQYDYSFPSLANDNHMICTVMLDGTEYFIDPTEKYIGFGEYAERIQGRPVMIEDGESYIISKVPEFTNEMNLVENYRKVSIEGDKIVGTTHTEYNGGEKINLLRGYNSLENTRKAESIVEFLADFDKNTTVTDHSTSNFEDREKSLVFDYSFETLNSIVSVGNESYLSLAFDKDYSNFIFDEPRITDYWFGLKILRKSNTELQIPEGYEVSFIPEKLNEQGNGFSFHGSYIQEGNKIIYRIEINIPSGKLEAEDIEDWNNSVKKLATFYNEQIVLKKI